MELIRLLCTNTLASVCTHEMRAGSFTISHGLRQGCLLLLLLFALAIEQIKIALYPKSSLS